MNILFMCVANSARSQMAEGLAREILGEKTKVYSAGSNPSSVNPIAIQVMKEIGIDISRHTSKTVDALGEKKFSCVITLCAEEVCPTYLGKAAKLHWPFPDPASVEGAAQKLEAFRTVRDGIKQKLEEYKSLQEKQRAKILDTTLGYNIDKGIQAFGALFLLKRIFYKTRENNLDIFRTHVANNLVYQALEALSEKCIVEVSEALNKEINLFGKLPIGLTGKGMLTNHRNIISHPMIFKADEWGNPAMRTFVENELHETDSRPLRLWQIKRQIQNLAETNLAAELVPRLEMIDMINLVLSYSSHTAQPVFSDLPTTVAMFFKQFGETLEREWNMDKWAQE